MTEENKSKKPRRKVDIRFSTIFWWVVLILSVLALVIMAVSGLVVDEANISSIAAFLRGMVSGSGLSPVVQEIGRLVSYRVVSGGLFGIMSAAITLSPIYIYKIPSIRRISLKTIRSTGTDFQSFAEKHGFRLPCPLKTGSSEFGVFRLFFPGWERSGNA